MTPLYKLPSEAELLLFLIQEDLKSRKIFNGLRNLDLDGCHYESDLGNLILKYAGFEEVTDAVYDLYYDLLNRCAENMKADNASVSQKAFEVYMELMMQKRNINK